MSLQFIYGYSGSGKSSYIFKRVVEEAQKDLRKNYYVVVPEQFTMQTQRELVALQSEQCIMNIDVVSFQRLAYRVFDELGRTDMAVLEETGKSLMLRKVAQDKKDELHVMRANMKKMGYIGEVKSLISELTQYNIEPDDLEQFLKENPMSPSFSGKMQDVLVMYRGFREALEGTYITSEEVLDVFCKLAGKSELLSNAVLVFDGFTGFTPIQNKLMHTLMELVGKIYVTVTIDGKTDPYSAYGMHELFAMSKKTVQSLTHMAEEAHIEVEEPVIINDCKKDRFVNAPAIRFLEQNIFRTQYETMEASQEIRICSLSNPRMELQFAAGEITRLVRSGACRYREIAVISGAVEEYGNYVPQIFSQYEIPYFLDTTKNLLLHPFIEFVRAVLQVMEENYSYEAVFRYLRCGFCRVTEEETDILENYVLAMGIYGAKKWNQRFALRAKGMKEEELEAVEAIRMKVIGPFAILQEVFVTAQGGSGEKDKSGVECSLATVRDITSALYRFIVSFGIEQQLKEKENRCQLAHDISKAKEYAQIYRIVMDLLDKLVSLLGDEEMTLDEYTKILDAGFEAARVGVIPSGYDRVMVGDMERSRLDGIKVLFMVGMNDGIVPKHDVRGGIISQFEREEMVRCNLTLAPTARERVFIQRFYLYLAMTKPSKQLYLTYAGTGNSGEALRPSYLVHMVEQIFTGLKVEHIADETIYNDITTPKSATSFLVEGLQQEGIHNSGWSEEQEAQWKNLVRWYHEHEEYSGKLARMIEARRMCYQEETIGRTVAKALYGSVLEGSVTRLEQYAACACAHFLTYGLRLKERELFAFEPADIGNIYHRALEHYAGYLQASSYTWFDVTEEIQQEIAERALGDAIAEAGNTALADTAKNRYQAGKMKKIFQRTIWALTRQIRQGRFTPSDFEVSFAFTEELDAVNFRLSEEEKMKLQGRIDRVDTYDTGDKLYVKIIDYKSGRAGFELLSLYHGLKLQLVVYMNAAMEMLSKKNQGKEIIPAGMFYYCMDDPVIEGSGNESEEEIYGKIFEKLRLDGVVNTNEEAYRALDKEITGKSNVIPLTLNKDGSVRASEKAVDEEQFALIASYANYVIKEAGESIIGGDTAVRPYELKDACSCTYCPYGAVCGYDAGIPGYEKRKLNELTPEEIYRKMKEVSDK